MRRGFLRTHGVSSIWISRKIGLKRREWLKKVPEIYILITFSVAAIRWVQIFAAAPAKGLHYQLQRSNVGADESVIHNEANDKALGLEKSVLVRPKILL